MKNFYLFLGSIFLLFASPAAFSQTETQPALQPIADTSVTVSSGNYPVLSYGIRGGANFSRFNINGGDFTIAKGIRDDRANHVRLQAGLVSNYAFNENVSLQAELLFTQKGMKKRGVMLLNKQLEEYKAQTILNYLEVPVLVKVSASVYGDSLKFFVNAGPSVSVLINGKDRLYFEDEAGTEGEEDIAFDYSNGTVKYKRLDASIHAGAGFELLTKFGSITVEGRGVFGLLNIAEADPKVVQNFPKIYNRSIGLYVTYFLPDLFK